MSLHKTTEQLARALDRLESTMPVSKKAFLPRSDFDENTVILFIGAVLGGLAHVAPPSTIRRAVRWWAENDEAWEELKQVKELTK